MDGGVTWIVLELRWNHMLKVAPGDMLCNQNRDPTRVLWSMPYVTTRNSAKTPNNVSRFTKCTTFLVVGCCPPGPKVDNWENLCDLLVLTSDGDVGWTIDSGLTLCQR